MSMSDLERESIFGSMSEGITELLEVLENIDITEQETELSTVKEKLESLYEFVEESM